MFGHGFGCREIVLRKGGLVMEKFELFLLSLIEFLYKLAKWLFIISFLGFLYLAPIYTLIFEEDRAWRVLSIFWIIFLHVPTLLSLIYCYYCYLIKKYRGGKLPNNAFIRYMESKEYGISD